MASRDRKKTSPAQSTKPSSVPLLLLAAFALGAGTTWLVMRSSNPAPEQPRIETFGPLTGGGTIAPLAPTAAAPPDTAGLPPAEAARTLANWNYDRQNWSHAIEHYEEAIAKGADTPDVRTDLGNCYRFSGQPQKALEQYQLAQKQNPQHENSLFNQISLYADFLHDKERALAAGQEFLARFPQSPQAATARQILHQIETGKMKSP